MGLVDNMAPHIKNALLEIPIAHRGEVSDALVEQYSFEEWRLEQDPVVDDTPANRGDYIAWMLAHNIVSRIKGVVRSQRSEEANASLDDDLGIP